MDADMDAVLAKVISDQSRERPFQQPYYYEGKDPQLKEQPYCFACHHPTTESALKGCSRCRVAWYCNSTCQEDHLKNHREICRRIAKDLARVEAEAIPLRTYTDPWGNTGAPENLFETSAGDFGMSDDIQAYLKARNSLANAYWDAAYESEVKHVWEKALFHSLELLRLDASYDCETRFRVPFILLYLNRDDDAYAFVRYWLNFDDSHVSYDQVVERHKRTREGDWLYPREPKCRYNHIFAECPKMEEQYLSLPYLVALAIIKLRIIAAHDAMSRSLDLAFHQKGVQRIQEVRSAVNEMILDSNVNIISQRQQLGRLLDLIHRKNPAMLASILNCAYFAETSQSFADAPDYPFPMNIILTNGLRCFFRVPGAADVLRQRL